jgi:hypothetical protein
LWVKYNPRNKIPGEAAKNSLRTRHHLFRLVDTQQSTTGAVLHVYERAGELRYGEVEVGQETVIFDDLCAIQRPLDTPNIEK